MIFLIVVFAAGVALGSLLTMAIMIVMRAKSDNETEKKRKFDSESKGKYLGPSKVWLSRAGQHFHVTVNCASLKLEGVQRRGVSEFDVYQHCAKKCSETREAENNHED